MKSTSSRPRLGEKTLISNRGRGCLLLNGAAQWQTCLPPGASEHDDDDGPTSACAASERAGRCQWSLPDEVSSQQSRNGGRETHARHAHAVDNTIWTENEPERRQQPQSYIHWHLNERLESHLAHQVQVVPPSQLFSFSVPGLELR